MHSPYKKQTSNMHIVYMYGHTYSKSKRKKRYSIEVRTVFNVKTTTWINWERLLILLVVTA